MQLWCNRISYSLYLRMSTNYTPKKSSYSVELLLIPLHPYKLYYLVMKVLTWRKTRLSSMQFICTLNGVNVLIPSCLSRQQLPCIVFFRQFRFVFSSVWCVFKFNSLIFMNLHFFLDNVDLLSSLLNYFWYTCIVLLKYMSST